MVIAQSTQPRRKYANRRVAHGDHFHDSQAELRYCDTLSALRRVGEIHNFEIHKRFILHDRAGAKLCDFYPDFVVAYPDGRREAQDVKGYQNPKDPAVRLFRQKCQLMAAEYGIPVRIVT